MTSELIQSPKGVKKKYPKYKKGDLEKLFSAFSKEDKDLINRMILICSNTMGEGKLKKVKRNIIQLRDVTNIPLKELTEEYLRWFFQLAKNSRAQQTVQEMHWQIKKFTLEILENYSLMKNIKTKHKRGIDTVKYSENNLITQEDLEKMGRFANSYKDKAFLFTSFFTGARPTEILQLTWNKIKFFEKYAEIEIYASKNDKIRNFPVPFECKKVLQDWKQNYSFPNINENKDFVFPSPRDRTKHLTTAGTNKMLRALSKKANLNKDVFNYLLRHSRSQKLYEELPVPIVEKLMAYKDMYRIYSDISNKKTKEQLFEKIYKIEELSKGENQRLKELEEKIEEIQKQLFSLSKQKIRKLKK